MFYQLVQKSLQKQFLSYRHLKFSAKAQSFRYSVWGYKKILNPFPSCGGAAFGDSRMTGWSPNQTKKGNPFGLPSKLTFRYNACLFKKHRITNHQLSIMPKTAIEQVVDHINNFSASHILET